MCAKERKGKVGESGNVNGGRAKGSRNRLSNALIEALAADFEEYGAGAIKILRAESSGEYCRLAASLVPKEVGIEVTNQAEVIAAWLGGFVGDNPQILNAVKARVTPAVEWQDAPPQLPEPINGAEVTVLNSVPAKLPERNQ